MPSRLWLGTLAICICNTSDAFQAAAPSMRIRSLFATPRATRDTVKAPGKSRKKGANSTKKRPNISTTRSDSQIPGPRPILTDYEANRNIHTNKQRLVQDIGCPHFGTCSGCSVSAQVGSVDTIQSASQFFSSTLVQRSRTRTSSTSEWDDDASDELAYPIIVPSPLGQWRTQAKLAVAPKSSSWNKDGCSLGLFARGTHNVLRIPDCRVHHPSINRAVALLEEASAKVGTPAYTGKREVSLRYVQFQVERITNKVCLTLVWSAESLKDTHPHLTRLTKELQRTDPKLWHSMWCHCNDGSGNNIFSRNPKRWHHLSGPEFVREPLPVSDNGWLYFSPLNFRQANMDGFDILARDVAQAVPGGSKVCELYAGVGLLSLTALAYHAELDPLEWVRCSDENPSNPRSFEKAVESIAPAVTGRNTRGKRAKEEETMTLAQLASMMESGALSNAKTTTTGDKISYLVADAAKALQLGQALGANVLIVDPPRKGLEPAVLSELCKPFNRAQPYVESSSALVMIPEERINWVNDVDTLIYVSCGFDALARDTEELVTSNAGWKIESSTGYVLFPGSNHVETICIFKRKLT
ncbi:hypothetical protein MPSEU_000704300 [Mayamaea pseudoterrestris]|nr:hypothetical protein MPSEU_000704300 [Mayamaea pseudoterrestris]